MTISVCTGASMLAAYGLLEGEAVATTHLLYEHELQQRYPTVHFVIGMRFVENDKISTTAGFTSGIDLALHVVERYIAGAPLPKPLPPTWSITAPYGRIPSWPPSRQRQRAGRSVPHGGMTRFWCPTTCKKASRVAGWLSCEVMN